MTMYVCKLNEIPKWIDLESALAWISDRYIPHYVNNDGNVTIETYSPEDMIFSPSKRSKNQKPQNINIIAMELEPHYEAAKLELLGCIQKGKIRSCGRRIKDSPSGDARLAFAEAYQWVEIKIQEPEPIPGDLWTMRGLNWSKDELITTQGVFTQLRTKLDDLIELFPPNKERIVEITQTNGFFVYLEENTEKSKKKRKRKTIFDWDAIFQEAVRLALVGKLGKTQADAMRKLNDWCSKKWGDHPAYSTMQNKLSPIYQNLNLDKPTKISS